MEQILTPSATLFVLSKEQLEDFAKKIIEDTLSIEKEDKFLSAKNVQEMFSISPVTLYEMENKGIIKGYQFDKNTHKRYSFNELIKTIKSNK